MNEELREQYETDPVLSETCFVYEPKPGKIFIGRYVDTGMLIRCGGMAMVLGMMAPGATVSDVQQFNLSEVDPVQYVRFQRAVLGEVMIAPTLAAEGEGTIRGERYKLADLGRFADGILAVAMRRRKDTAPLAASSEGRKD